MLAGNSMLAPLGWGEQWLSNYPGHTNSSSSILAMPSGTSIADRNSILTQSLTISLGWSVYLYEVVYMQ